MVNVFIFHRDLRLYDNTTLIQILKELKEPVLPIFILTPEQIEKKINKYFSNNSVQFMIESLIDLNEQIEKYNGKLYFFKGDTIKILKYINSIHNIKTIGFNIDYTPYAIERDNKIKTWCNINKINIISEEDVVLYNILNGKTKNINTGNPYVVYTYFKKHCLNNLKINEINKFNDFNFYKTSKLKDEIKINELKKYYEENENINIHGGRSNGLKILKNIEKFKDYNKKRDCLNYNTTFLGAHLHFCTLSPREVYYNILNKLGKNNNLINELHWRDFYMNITFYYPQVLKGKSFKENYDNIKWEEDNEKFNLWCKGQTGFPIIDASMNQLNITGYMHNRCRMIVASFLTKDLRIDWRLGEKYFASKLVDYSPMQNNGGWQWASSSGCDSQPYFRIFNPWTQSKKYDPECEYIKKWIPKLKDVNNKDIHNWNKKHILYKIDYPSPIVDHDKERLITLKLYKKYI